MTANPTRIGSSGKRAWARALARGTPGSPELAWFLHCRMPQYAGAEELNRMRALMAGPLDPRIVECWRAGMRSAVDIGQRIGVPPRHIARRIARLERAGVWPFASSTPNGHVESQSPRFRPAALLPLIPASGVPSKREGWRSLNLRIPDALYAQLRRHCRQSGATVGEIIASALDAYLSSDLGAGDGWTPTGRPTRPSSR